MPQPVTLAALVAWRVRLLRRRRGWTQEDLAFRAGLSVSLVARLEQRGGRLRVRTDTIDALARGFGMGVLEFVGARRH